MPNSNSKPETLRLDRIENGICRLRVCWDIVESTKEDPMTGETRTSWDYSERVIWWTLDYKDLDKGTLEEIRTYLKDNEKTILTWALATVLNYNGTECKKDTG